MYTSQVNTNEELQLPHCKKTLLHLDEWTNKGFVMTREEELHLIQDTVVMGKVKLSLFEEVLSHMLVSSLAATPSVKDTYRQCQLFMWTVIIRLQAFHIE